MQGLIALFLLAKGLFGSDVMNEKYFNGYKTVLVLLVISLLFIFVDSYFTRYICVEFFYRLLIYIDRIFIFESIYLCVVL